MRPHLWLIRFIGLIVPRRLRSDWRQEWEAELRHREALLEEWDRLDGCNKLDLLRRSLGAFRDALLLQPRRWEDEMFQDLRFGLRMLLKSRAVTSVAVLSLALGIGANTALFSLLDAVLLKTLPVKEPEQLVLFRWLSGPKTMARKVGGDFYTDEATGLKTASVFSYRMFEQFRAHHQTLAELFAFAPLEQLNVNINGQAEIAGGQLVSGNYYSGLGVRAVLGRTIAESDDQPSASPVAVLSHRYWQRRFGLDPAILGQTLNLNGTPFIIIGVTPPEFHGALQVSDDPDLSIALAKEPLARAGGPAASALGEPWEWWLQVMGRLKPGANVEQVRASFDGIFQETAREGWQALPQKPGSEPRDLPRLKLTSGSQGLTELREAYSQPLKLLLVIVGLTLLIACANVANLLLARAAARQKELAVRLALGASRFRLIRQLLTESVLLALLGGLLGLLFAWWGEDALLALRPWGGGELALDLKLDLRVLGFTAAVSALTGLLFGLAPALRATRVELNSSLKESAATGGGLSRSALTKSLVVVQVALSVLLLVGAGLFVRTLHNLQSVEVGFNRENVLTFRVDPRLNGYKREQIPNLYQQMIERIEAVPGVRSATFSRHTILGGGGANSLITVSGRAPQPNQDRGVQELWLRSNFFETMEIPLLGGRGLTAQDHASAPKVAVVNQALVRKFFPNEEPLGKRFIFGLPRDPKAAPDPEKAIEIVGIVRDAKRALRQETPPTVFVPAVQNPSGLGQMAFAVRTAGDPSAMISAIRAAAREVDANLPLFEFTTQKSQAEKSLAPERLFAHLTTFFGLLALLLSSIGLYGVMAYAVVQRTREIGLRMALGAQASDVLWLVLRDALRLALLGVALGLPAALAAARLLASQLFGVSAADPLTLGLVTLVLLVVAAIAGYLPARRAARVDPLVALRCE